MFSLVKQKVLQFLVTLPAKIFAGLFIFYCLFGYFAVNPLAKKLVPWIAEKKLASIGSVGKVTFDPLRLKATVENFKLTEKSGAPLAGFAKLVVDFEASGIFKRAWKFKEISLVDPQALIAISPQGKLNWADLIAKLNEDKTPPDDTIPRLIIQQLSVKLGNIDYVDASRATPLKAAITPLDFELGQFSTLPQDRGNYLIAANFPEQGGTLKWKGNIGVNPVASKGFVALDGVKIAKLMNIAKGVYLPLTVSQGDAQTSFEYNFSLPNNKPKLVLNNVALNLNSVVGDAPNAKVSLKQANLTIPRLDFVMNNAPQLQFQDLNMKFSGFEINSGSQSLLVLPQVAVNHVSMDLAARNAKVGQVLLPQGSVSAVMGKTGTVNWQQAFAAPTNESEPAKAASTQPSLAKTANTTEVEAPFTLEIADVQLQHWKLAYLDQTFLNPLQTNVADFNLSLALAMPKGEIAITQIQSKAIGISAKSTANKQVASLDNVQLSDGEVLIAEQKVSIPSVIFSGLKTQIIKETNKPLNWQTILAPATSSVNNTVANKTSNKADWAVSLKKVALENASFHIEDRSLTSPVVMDVEKINAEMRDSSLDLKKALPIKVDFKVKQGGQFSTQGKLTPLPFAANLDVKLNQLSLIPFAPYINQFALLTLNQGAADLTGKLAVKNSKALALSFNGGFDVNHLNVVEEISGAPFLSWERLGSRSLQVSLAPNRLQMAELQIVKPVGKFIINQDKSMNVTKFLRNQPATVPVAPTKVVAVAAEHKALPASNGMLDGAKSLIASKAKTADDKSFAPPPLTASTQEEAFPVNIETVRIDNAALEFADLSLVPQFGTNIHSLTGVINGVSTNAASTAQVELDGRVDDYGAARIRGSLQPFNVTNFTDLKLSFTNIEMNRLTPYSGKFAGRRIDSGKLSVDLEYKIKQRQLAGENKFVINKLKLGEKIKSADAADLPLDLAIAILEDSDGVIDLELPITGSLDDPQFSYGSIVWKAIRNVLGKIVTAPFRALGKLFGGSGDKLEAITFEAGGAVLSPPELEKIKMVSTALAKRQGLALGIVPAYDEALDIPAIQEHTVRSKVAEEMGLTLAEGQAAGPIDLNNAKAQKAIDNLYDTLTKKSLLKKLASKLEKPKEGHYEETVQKLTASIQVTDTDLQALAKSRGEAIQKALLAAGVSADRIHIDAPEKHKGDGNAKDINTRLTLDVNQKVSVKAE
ncbi:DUF748 domain-containing protein [Methylotenera versatilis]|uniref:OmpA-like domain-containing protein n=1 Tax=Methylotenera versatilis (strain 301) TaxID=666681 RepID=D7DJX2_METV0|nr:DUF748 domain-containing protein [Methylotenera versatilis]ADI30333.1 protein of unknown function DUF748 [Methylotenera versatilis 301]